MSDDMQATAQMPLYAANRGAMEAARGAHKATGDFSDRTMAMPPLSATPTLSSTALKATTEESNDHSSSHLLTLADFNDAISPNGLEDLAAARKQHRLPIIIVVSLLVLIVAAAVGGFFGAHAYYQHRAAPGVSFAGQSVSGQDSQELKHLVSVKAQSTQLTILDDHGSRVKASLKDLGVTVDVNATVQQILSAKSSNALAKINPLEKASIPLNYHSDDLVMSSFLTKSFVEEDTRAVPSSIAFDAGTKTFAVHPGKEGQAPELDPVKAALDSVCKRPGQDSQVTITYKNVNMPIEPAAAQKAADEANERLKTPLVIDNGDATQFSVPTERVASWIAPSADLSKGSITLDYKQDAIKTYVTQDLPDVLNQDMVPEKNLKNEQGKVLTVLSKGTNGVKVKNTEAIASQIVSQLKSGQIAPIKAEADIVPHKEESRVARYDVPDGDMWIEVNLSTQTATAYKGTTQVKSFPICSGLPRNGDESDLGTFFINVRYDVQTMRGPGYVSPNVHWVSYYNGSEGFHTALWNYDAIAHGDAFNRGSHGCINMYEQDAKWVYDNAPIGTMVKVVGAQPTGPVR